MHWSRCNPFAGSDIKRCWELSRWGWAPLFARAWCLTGDIRYRDELNKWSQAGAMPTLRMVVPTGFAVRKPLSDYFTPCRLGTFVISMGHCLIPSQISLLSQLFICTASLQLNVMRRLRITTTGFQKLPHYLLVAAGWPHLQVHMHLPVASGLTQDDGLLNGA